MSNTESPLPPDAVARLVSAVQVAAGDAIKRRREMIGLSRLALGTLAGVTGQQIAKYEAGTGALTVGRFVQLCQLLHLDPTAPLSEIVTATWLGAATRAEDARPAADRRALQSLVRHFSAIASPEERAAIVRLVRALAVQ